MRKISDKTKRDNAEWIKGSVDHDAAVKYERKGKRKKKRKEYFGSIGIIWKDRKRIKLNVSAYSLVSDRLFRRR